MTRGRQRRSGASVVAAWLAASVGACGVGVLLARRCPGKRHGAFAAPPAPHRPQTLPARLCEAARSAPRPTYSRERRRGRAPSWGRFTRCSPGGAGARERRDAPRCAWPPWDCGRCPGKRHGALPLSPGAATRSSREAARGVSVRRVLFAAKAARCTSIESASRRKRAKMCARDKQKRATALFLRDRPQAFPFGSSFTFPFPLAPLDGHKPAQAR